MKQLTEYKRNGLTWQLLTRKGNAAIFQSRYGYEVIVIQSHNGRTIAGNYCEPAEYPPSNEQWGSKGWSYRTDQLWQAEIKLADLAPTLIKTSSPSIG